MNQFMDYCNKTHGLALDSYEALYQWSIKSASVFWGAVWDFCGIITHEPYSDVVDDLSKMPGATWFKGAKLNFAKQFLQRKDDRVALIAQCENGPLQKITFSELYDEVSKRVQLFESLGLKAHDRVAAVLPNGPEAIYAMLACTALGAIWSSCAPEFGAVALSSRFKQVIPSLCLVSDAYQQKGEIYDCQEKIKTLQNELSSDTRFIKVSSHLLSKQHIEGTEALDELLAPFSAKEIHFSSFPADHPVYILFSSGTTGLPKCIVHRAGGVLVQHLKELKLHCDLKEGDRLMYMCNCAWMMWNWMLSGLVCGATLYLFDGSPFYPGYDYLLQQIKEQKINIFGLSPKYLSALEAKKIDVSEQDFSYLRLMLSTGSVLSEKNAEYVSKSIKKGLGVTSISGGTDIISCFALGAPNVPIQAGRLSTRGLGMAVDIVDHEGTSVNNQAGELVCTQAFPSMPLFFWNDENFEKYKAAYFKKQDGIWYHGDQAILFSDGSLQILGRSDATLNPSGVRIGSAELYTVLEQNEKIKDSVAISHVMKKEAVILLFVVLNQGEELNAELKKEIKETLKTQCSRYHVPKQIIQVADIPYTINGKKVELAVKQSVEGQAVLQKEQLQNPECLTIFESFGKRLTV